MSKGQVLINRILKVLSIWGIVLAALGFIITFLDQFVQDAKVKDWIHKILFIVSISTLLLIILARARRLKDFFVALWHIGKMREYLHVENYKKNIAVLLPLSTDDAHFKREVENAITGIGNALKHSRKYLERVDIRYFDHRNDPRVATRVIKNELINGTCHFVCTMSVVCDDLVDPTKPTYFNSIISEALKSEHGDQEAHDRAILVCTLAASESANFNRNIYRLFVQTDHEARELVSKAINRCLGLTTKKDKPKMNVCVMHSENDYHVYLKQMSDKVTELLNNKYAIRAQKNLALDVPQPLVLSGSIKLFIDDNKSTLSNSDIIFLFVEYNLNEEFYKAVIDDCLDEGGSEKKEEDRIFKKDTIIAVSTLYPGFLRGTHDRRHVDYCAKLNALGIKMVWVTPMRKVKKNSGQISNIENPEFYGEMSEFCMSTVIKKLIGIITTPGYTVSNQNFHKLWVDNKEPSSILISYDENKGNDPFIELN